LAHPSSVALDYERLSEHTLFVGASSTTRDGQQQGQHWAYHRVHVRVDDVNDNRPRWTTTSTWQSVRVEENTVGLVEWLARVEARDPDSGPAGRIR
jgi:hypothetical protein